MKWLKVSLLLMLLCLTSGVAIFLKFQNFNPVQTSIMHLNAEEMSVIRDAAFELRTADGFYHINLKANNVDELLNIQMIALYDVYINRTIAFNIDIRSAMPRNKITHLNPIYIEVSKNIWFKIKNNTMHDITHGALIYCLDQNVEIFANDFSTQYPGFRLIYSYDIFPFHFWKIIKIYQQSI